MVIACLEVTYVCVAVRPLCGFHVSCGTTEHGRKEIPTFVARKKIERKKLIKL